MLAIPNPAAIRNLRRFSRLARPHPAAAEPVVRVANNVARLGPPKAGPMPRQLLSLPPFPGHPLPGRNSTSSRVTAVTWLKYYFDEVDDTVVRSHFNKGLVYLEKEGREGVPMRKIKTGDVMEKGMRVCVPVSVAETRIKKRFDTIPSGTLHPNADEIAYMQRLVEYKDSAILVLNKPPRVPVKGNMTVHNSMDALAAAALSYGSDEAPKLVHRLDRESSGLLLMGRTEGSVSHLQWLFSGQSKSTSCCKEWDDAREATYQRYWALVIGRPKEKEGLIHAPLSKVILDDGKSERVVLAQCSGFEAWQEAITEYRVMGPMINGCSWIELHPLTGRKDQLRVHCAEALGTPVVGDYKYGWFMHKKWKQMPQINVEPLSGEPYKLRRPANLDVQKGSVLSKVPLLHLHCREVVLPNMAKYIPILDRKPENMYPALRDKPNILRFVAKMPMHMRISWNLMSSYLV